MKNLTEKIMIKKFLKLIIPPLVLNFLIFLKKKLKQDNYTKQPKNQSLNVYYEKKMAKLLETWGERNVWIEIQHLLLNKKGKILDIACGTGKVIEILSQLNIKEVYGCDISEFLIEKAIKRGISKDRIICAYVFLPLPLWFGVFISNKKLRYLASIFVWGSFWMVGLIAYYGMNCGIDWLQK